MLFEFITIHTQSCTQRAEKPSMSFKFELLLLPRLTQGNLLEYGYTLTSFTRHHAPCACLCSEKRQSLLFSTHLFVKGASQIRVHCHCKDLQEKENLGVPNGALKVVFAWWLVTLIHCSTNVCAEIALDSEKIIYTFMALWSIFNSHYTIKIEENKNKLG